MAGVDVEFAVSDLDETIVDACLYFFESGLQKVGLCFNEIAHPKGKEDTRYATIDGPIACFTYRSTEFFQYVGSYAGAIAILTDEDRRYFDLLFTPLFRAMAKAKKGVDEVTDRLSKHGEAVAGYVELPKHIEEVSYDSRTPDHMRKAAKDAAISLELLQGWVRDPTGALIVMNRAFEVLLKGHFSITKKAKYQQILNRAKSEGLISKTEWRVLNLMNSDRNDCTHLGAECDSGACLKHFHKAIPVLQKLLLKPSKEAKG